MVYLILVGFILRQKPNYVMEDKESVEGAKSCFETGTINYKYKLILKYFTLVLLYLVVFGISSYSYYQQKQNSIKLKSRNLETSPLLQK